MDSITVAELVAMIEQGPIRSWTSHGGSEDCFQIKATQFNDFAFEDAKNDTIHGRVNTLSNVKRSIECRIDEILHGLCLNVKSEKEQWSFPKKVKVLGDLGIIAPRILEKINRQRNKLEHEYLEPTKEDVEDALDIAVLFLRYTSNLHSICGLVLCSGENYEVAVDRKQGKLTFTEKGKEPRTVKIGYEEDWLKMAKLLRSVSSGFP